MKLPAAALILALSAAPAAAYPVNFGNTYINAPGHGLLISQPTYTLDGSGYAVFNYVATGLVPHVGLALENTYVAVPSYKTDFANTLITLLYGAAPNFSVGPVAGVKTGSFGRSFLGVRAFLDQPLHPDLTWYTTVGYYYSPDGQPDPHRFKLDSSLDYHGFPGWDLNLELMSGSPNWDYGPTTRLAIAPGVARSFGSFTLFTSLRVPISEPPIAIVGAVYGW